MASLVMIPGVGCDAAVWRPTIEALGADVDCRVSEPLAGDCLGGMAARVLADAPDRFSLAGVSMGGLVALEIMRMAPERVLRLALVGCSARPDTRRQAARRRYASARIRGGVDFEAATIVSLETLLAASAGAAVRASVVAMAMRLGPEVYLRQNEAEHRADLWPVLETVRVPTIIVVGAEDVMTPVALSAEMAAAIPCATLHVIPDCGHLPTVEVPEAVAETFRGWLRRV